ncbi:MAG: biotin--acetyl-CoA-carboxylase ligase [Candidatus Adiutrix sp.]|jgi:BirA family biotin operon repressor/biotin-[acetyl-CoA-carboxylase] ligase|nr:biotin--acetyl-CoA-carboxylase ligase [Candidatus Adiutrix sp.]
MPVEIRGRPPFFRLGPGTSSLDAAWELIDRGRLPVWGSLLMASQSAGRGRLGRAWQSPAGHVYGALRLPTAPPFNGPGASPALAYLLAEALADFGWNLAVKWPNDLIFEGRKVGGLLLEARREALVAGLGLNLLAPPAGDWQLARDPGAPPPGALPFPGEPEALWRPLVKSVLLGYNKKFAASGLEALIPLIETRLCWRGRQVRVERPAAEPPAPENGLAGRLAGLGPEGQLILEAREGRYQLWSGTLSLL